MADAIPYHYPPPSVRDWWKQPWPGTDPVHDAKISDAERLWSETLARDRAIVEAKEARDREEQVARKQVALTEKLARAERRVAIYQMRSTGATLRAIGKKFKLSPERVRQVIQRIERQQRNWLHRRTQAARPIDMGGPRDVWITFVPGPDPRLDWQIPVTP